VSLAGAKFRSTYCFTVIESQRVTVMGWADDERFGDGGHMRPVLSIGGISVVITLQDS
jgi:hypothetical protein